MNPAGWPTSRQQLRIAEVSVTPVAAPDPPLLNHRGVHESTFVRAIVRIQTSSGLEGLGEGPGGSLYVQALEAAARHLIGGDPFEIERHRILTGATPQVFAPLESALLDIMGKATDRPIYDLLGGAVRRRVPFAAYLFYKEAGEDDWGEALTPETLVQQAQRFHDRYGMTAFKLKGGVLEPDLEIATMRLMRERFGPAAKLRLDPNAAWSVATSIRVARELADCDLEYLEDPTEGIEGMAQVAAKTDIPLSTNMCVTQFDHIATAFRLNAVRVVLGDHHHWGGLIAFRNLGVVCATLKWGLAQHSNSHLGISFAGMIHAAAAIPQLTYASDTHYPWNPQDIVAETDRFHFQDGAIEIWDAPGLGVTIDEQKFQEAAEAFQQRTSKLGRDDVSAMRERNPDWFPLMPRW